MRSMGVRWVLVLMAGMTLQGMTAVSGQNESPELSTAERSIRLAGGFGFAEGPAADAEGNIYFTDNRAEKILFWDVGEKKLSVFIEVSEGANGLAFGPDGMLYAMRHRARDVVKIDTATKEITVVADRFEGKRFNEPNDVWFDAKGGFYFTDPNYHNRREELEQGGRFVYYVEPDHKTVRRATEAMDQPNGIHGSPDGKTLYIAEWGARKTWAYPVGEDASLGERRLLCEVRSDGMAVDEHGNIYLTENNRQVTVFSPAGERITELRFPEGPANVTFGGPDRKTLFVTATSGLYSVEMSVRGLGPAWKRGKQQDD